MPKYLTTQIVACKIVPAKPYAGMCRSGYTRKSGAPTDHMVRLAGDYRWRRIMVWCFSNSGTAFVRVRGECLIVRDSSYLDLLNAK